MKFVIVTQNGHLSSCLARACRKLKRSDPELDVRLHLAADWTQDPVSTQACREDLANADLVLVSQIFLEEHQSPILPVLEERRESYRALVCILSGPQVSRLTRMGRLSMTSSRGGSPFMAALRRLKPGSRGDKVSHSGRRQMSLLKKLPRLLRLIPGPAQDLRAYFLTMQYWLAGSDENVVSLIRFLVDRYGQRESARSRKVPLPRSYPAVGLYHPDLNGGLTESPEDLPTRPGPRVGVLLMRSNLLAGNTRHYDAVIRALEAKGLAPVPAFCAELDQRAAVERFFRRQDGTADVEVMVSLTGFSLVGGPAYNDADGARAQLKSLGVPYIVAQPLELQTIEGWEGDARGLTPIQASLMVSIPELDGATGAIVFGGRSGDPGDRGDSVPIPDRVERLAERVAALARLRRSTRHERRLGIVLFNFPPGAGTVGTAAYLDVFGSLYRLLRRLADEGYDVDLPSDVDALREAVLEGNRRRYGAPANVLATVSVDDHVASETWLEEIEAAWGPPPGRQFVSGSEILVLGARFGSVVVGVQPPMGYSGDPMRLLFEADFAPTHAFSAFYRWMRESFGAHALLHFGTHGAMEFMPGKHVGLSGDCWPDRLIQDTPNVYLYAANNPSEGALAKRRGSATLVSHLTPPLVEAGLYRQMETLKATVDRMRQLGPDADAEEVERLIGLVRTQAEDAGIALEEPIVAGDLHRRLMEIEHSLIPHGLHRLGVPPGVEEMEELLLAMVAGDGSHGPHEALAEAARQGALGGSLRRIGDSLTRAGIGPSEARSAATDIVTLRDRLLHNEELDGLVGALDGQFVEPAPAGDLLRRPEILPTGRNLYAFDPFRVPSAVAMAEGKAQAARIIEAHRAAHGTDPETVGMVLWGTDNLKASRCAHRSGAGSHGGRTQIR